MRFPVTLASRFFCVLAASLALETSPAAERRPNIVVIISDDMGFADVGFNGCKDTPTPHIDSLAREGVRCRNGYVSHPFCSPTRAGVLTGRYQQRFGHENNPRYEPTNPKAGLPLDQITLAQVLKDAGYVTIAVGKWHLGAAPESHPNRRGFTDFFGFLGGGHVYLPGEKGGAEYTIPILRNSQPVDEKEYLTDAFSREAAAYIQQHKARPFFLYLAYNAVHTPMHTTDKYLSRFPGIANELRRKYAAMQSALDDGIGRVLQALKAEELERDTLVFFFSDNGGPVGINGSSNDPLRGAKGQMYEGGIHIPFVVRWPGKLPAGKVYDEPVISLDVFQTAVELAGAKAPSDRKLDSVNLVPYLTGQKKGAPHERLFWRAGGGERYAVREGQYKLVKQGDAEELFDLKADPSETTNLAVQKPDVLARLHGAFEKWNAELVPPVFESPPGGKRKKK
ncbi:MAG: sulfatase-like hydrolase/transferase [Verrucomicrobiota bacterium]